MPVSPQSNPIKRLAALSRERTVLKAVSFAVVGVMNVGVDFAGFLFAYYYLGLSIITANVLSWIVAVSGSYVMNSLITFARESGRQLRLKAYLKFVLGQSVGLGVNTLTLLLASYLMPLVFGKVLAIGASFVVNFSISHWVVFRARQP